MPVVTLYFSRLTKLLGRKVSREKILSTLPFLGLDIEEEAADHVNIEYSPNRPDFSTDYGVATGLEGMLGIKLGAPLLKIKKGSDTVRVDKSVSKVRPFILVIEARGRKLDDETIRQIIAMQEDLHNGLGRRRKKASVGIHDLDKVKFPLVYKAVDRSHRLVPLGSAQEMSISQVLEGTETGVTYRHLLEGFKKVPMIVDREGRTISFPPIINSSHTEITPATKNLLVEVTATDRNAAEDTMAVIAQTLQKAGFTLYSIKMPGRGNSLLDSRKMMLDPSLVRGMLGMEMTTASILKSLRKSRLDARTKGKLIMCTLPRYRSDILGPTDLVEEAALGYGINNISPTIPESGSAGQKNPVTVALEAARDTMVGLGFLEVMNFGLVGKQMQYDLPKRDSSGMLSVTDSKSQEHQILRDSLLPGLVDTLSRNIHESYPQKIFEIGTVFHKANPIREEIRIAAVAAHNGASFTEIKSILQSLFKSGFDISCTTKISHDPLFEEGRTAEILVDGKQVGKMGELSSAVLENFKLRVPASGFEIKLTGLIFD